MAEWKETYRGVVSAWECDVVEHFTIAYYFERFADATRNFLELIGAAEAGCFSMALAFNLEKAGHPAKRVSTTANVKLEPGDSGFKMPHRLI